jgi:hypothetical protein
MADVKPGYRSTEFYGSAVGTILGGVAASGLLSPDMLKLVETTAASIPEIVQIIDALFDGAVRLCGVIFGIGAQVKYAAIRARVKKLPQKVVINK